MNPRSQGTACAPQSLGLQIARVVREDTGHAITSVRAKACVERGPGPLRFTSRPRGFRRGWKSDAPAGKQQMWARTRPHRLAPFPASPARGSQCLKGLAWTSAVAGAGRFPTSPSPGGADQSLTVFRGDLKDKETSMSPQLNTRILTCSASTGGRGATEGAGSALGQPDCRCLAGFLSPLGSNGRGRAQGL